MDYPLQTTFEHKVVHKCTWHQSTLGQRMVIDFVVLSSDVHPYVLDTRVKRREELPTNHQTGIESELGCLVETPVWEIFNSHLQESFSHLCGHGI